MKAQGKPSTSSAAKDKGTGVAQPVMVQEASATTSSATTNNSTDCDYEPSPSFEYDDEIQSRYTAHRLRAGKAKVGGSSSVVRKRKSPIKLLKQKGEGKSAASPSSFDARSPLPKPKPQVLGLVCKRAQSYAEGKDLKDKDFPNTKELVWLLKGDETESE